MDDGINFKPFMAQYDRQDETSGPNFNSPTKVNRRSHGYVAGFEYSAGFGGVVKMPSAKDLTTIYFRTLVGDKFSRKMTLSDLQTFLQAAENQSGEVNLTERSDEIEFKPFMAQYDRQDETAGLNLGEPPTKVNRHAHGYVAGVEYDAGYGGTVKIPSPDDSTRVYFRTLGGDKFSRRMKLSDLKAFLKAAGGHSAEVDLTRKDLDLMAQFQNANPGSGSSPRSENELENMLALRR